MIQEKENFLSGNTCWICENLIEDDNEKVRDHSLSHNWKI